MSLTDDINGNVSEIFRTVWTTTDATVVPDAQSVTLGNTAKYLERATVLYADLSGSTALVDSSKWQFAGEIYKTFLECAARLVKEAGGSITAYDGDRIMAVFIGKLQSNNAVRCGLKINYAVKRIIIPNMKKHWSTDYQLRHVVGIDTSPIRAARIGVRGDNDLVWIGRAANHAAKLTELSADYPTWITKSVYDYLKDDLRRYNGTNEAWEKRLWTTMDRMEIYRSTCWCVI